MATWQLQTAKAKLSELLRAVREEGPQVISVRGKEEYVVTRKDGAAASKPVQPATAATPKTLWDLFEPVRGLGDDLEQALREVREETAPFDYDE
jgi:prevent-host-death family protein